MLCERAVYKHILPILCTLVKKHYMYVCVSVCVGIGVFFSLKKYLIALQFWLTVRGVNAAVPHSLL